MTTGDPTAAIATDAEAEAGTTPRGYGTAMAVYVVLSSMVGVGVLTTSGFTIASVGSNQLMLALWLFGGIVALCGALSIAEMAAAMPESGGDYLYLYQAYGPLPAFLSGWVVCRACSTAWGCESPAQPDGGEVLAKRKGVVARWRLKEARSQTAT
jgi:hypothetical protein